MILGWGERPKEQRDEEGVEEEEEETAVSLFPSLWFFQVCLV